MDTKSVLIEHIGRMNYLIQYESNKTMLENLVHEQTAFERKLDKIYSDPVSAQKFNQQNKQLLKDLNDYFKTYDAQDWLALIEISTGILSFLPTPLAPIFAGISTTAGVASALLYYKEGDVYMGTLMLILSVIPGGELMRILRKSKIIQRLGVKGTKEVIEKAKSGQKLTKQESEELLELSKEVTEKSNEITPKLNKHTKREIIKTLAKKSQKYLANLFLNLSKKGLVKFSMRTLSVAGIIYSFDKIYLYVYRDVIFSQKNLDNRTKNELRFLVNKLLGYDKEVTEYLVFTVADTITNMTKDPNAPDLVKISSTEEIDKDFAKISLNNMTTYPNKNEFLNFLKSNNKNFGTYDESSGIGSDSKGVEYYYDSDINTFDVI